jgi:hypothetical protein
VETWSEEAHPARCQFFKSAGFASMVLTSVDLPAESDDFTATSFAIANVTVCRETSDCINPAMICRSDELLRL